MKKILFMLLFVSQVLFFSCKDCPDSATYTISDDKKMQLSVGDTFVYINESETDFDTLIITGKSDTIVYIGDESYNGRCYYPAYGEEIKYKITYLGDTNIYKNNFILQLVRQQNWIFYYCGLKEDYGYGNYKSYYFNFLHANDFTGKLTTPYNTYIDVFQVISGYEGFYYVNNKDAIIMYNIDNTENYYLYKKY
jgi:hypothetical protein